MKFKLLTSALTVSALTLFTSLTANHPANANGTTFVCGTSNGKPTTLARTPEGDVVPVIHWVSDYFSGSGYDPQTRCEIVSNKFQEYYNRGTLNFLTTGRENGYDVVCVAELNGGACTGTLFTLKQGSNPGQTLQRLIAIRARNSGPLNESYSRVYIDMNEYLTNATASENSDRSGIDSNNVTPPRESPSDSLW